MKRSITTALILGTLSLATMTLSTRAEPATAAGPATQPIVRTVSVQGVGVARYAATRVRVTYSIRSQASASFSLPAIAQLEQNVAGALANRRVGAPKRTSELTAGGPIGYAVPPVPGDTVQDILQTLAAYEHANDQATLYDLQTESGLPDDEAAKETAQRDSQRNALVDAKRQATLVAETLGVRVGPPITVARPETTDAAADDEAGHRVLHTRVDVLFELVP